MSEVNEMPNDALGSDNPGSPEDKPKKEYADEWQALWERDVFYGNFVVWWPCLAGPTLVFVMFLFADPVLNFLARNNIPPYKIGGCFLVAIACIPYIVAWWYNSFRCPRCGNTFNYRLKPWPPKFSSKRCCAWCGLRRPLRRRVVVEVEE